MLLVPRNNSYSNYELGTINVHGYFIRQNVQICNFLSAYTFRSADVPFIRTLVRIRIQCETRLRIGYELDYSV